MSQSIKAAVLTVLSAAVGYGGIIYNNGGPSQTDLWDWRMRAMHSPSRSIRSHW